MHGFQRHHGDRTGGHQEEVDGGALVAEGRDAAALASDEKSHREGSEGRGFEGEADDRFGAHGLAQQTVEREGHREGTREALLAVARMRCDAETLRELTALDDIDLLRRQVLSLLSDC